METFEITTSNHTYICTYCPITSQFKARETGTELDIYRPTIDSLRNHLHAIEGETP